MKKLLVGLLVFLLVGFVAGGFVAKQRLDQFLNNDLAPLVSESTGLQVDIGAVALDLWSGSIEIADFTIANPTGYSADSAVRFSTLKLSLVPMTLLNQPIHLQEFLLAEPAVLVEVNSAYRTNIQVMLDELEARYPRNSGTSEVTEPEQGSSDVKVRIDAFTIDGAQLTLDASALNQPSQSIRLPALSIEPIGNPDGVLANEAARIIVLALLQDAKRQATQALKDAAEERAKEELEERARGLLEDIFKR
ncbi:AsmA family protein [Umboniibacter marinipuniceus]|uniref:AsmA-like protein n=1 Tax=Umboniibacter marinipuniceus TaxID=569599 RepID=A0A3M0ABP2_9GAMM|nr:AsmA family protein [Umboniibacter marinipuniceus]RMA82581.1 AsmA-like protein [Umboniibacter marinipuniceus]